MCLLLDNHFATEPYLLGTPTMADFALAGPFVAHLGRDPWPRDNLVSQYPNLEGWVRRISSATYKDLEGTDGTSPHSLLTQGIACDDIPITLTPILSAICSEFVPMLEATAAQVTALKDIDKFKSGTVPLPRSLEDITFPLGSSTFSRRGSPFSLWKIQLLLDGCAGMSTTQKTELTTWMKTQPFPVARVLQLQFPRVQRCALAVIFEKNSK